MAEKPILFSGPMVRAILEGRKTQTRRVIKLPHNNPLGQWEPSVLGGKGFTDKDGKPVPEFPVLWHTRTGDTISSRFWPGDILWVRETSYAPPKPLKDCLGYAADGDIPHGVPYRVVPSIFMARKDSRISLEVISVRPERLQDITEEDAMKEGLTGITKDGTLVKYGIPDRDGLPGTDDTGWPWVDWCANPIDAFHHLWDSINSKTHPWAANDWVWRYEFRRKEEANANIH